MITSAKDRLLIDRSNPPNRVRDRRTWAELLLGAATKNSIITVLLKSNGTAAPINLLRKCQIRSSSAPHKSGDRSDSEPKPSNDQDRAPSWGRHWKQTVAGKGAQRNIAGEQKAAKRQSDKRD